MTLRQFHNGLRILLNIDCHELVAAGVIRPGDDGAWIKFREDPFRWMIRAPDPAAEALWAIIESRNGK